MRPRQALQQHLRTCGLDSIAGSLVRLLRRRLPLAAATGAHSFKIRRNESMMGESKRRSGINGEMGGAAWQKPDGAAQEVAPLHARPCGRSSRIGSFCDASRSQSQAWGRRSGAFETRAHFARFQPCFDRRAAMTIADVSRLARKWIGAVLSGRKVARAERMQMYYLVYQQVYRLWRVFEDCVNLGIEQLLRSPSDVRELHARAGAMAQFHTYAQAVLRGFS